MRRVLVRLLKSISFRLNKLAKNIANDSHEKLVENGYFKNTKIVGEAYCSMLEPKIYGSYEKELWDFVWPFIEDLNSGIFIDVGCAEGFYLAAFASLEKFDSYIGVDIDQEALKAAQRNILLNSQNGSVDYYLGTDLFDIGEQHGLNFSDQRGMVLIDIEGAELDLVNKEFLDVFKNYVIIIELHDFTNPFAFREFIDNVTSITKRRYKIINTIDAWEKSLLDQYSWETDASLRLKRMNEFRGNKMRWLVLY